MKGGITTIVGTKFLGASALTLLGTIPRGTRLILSREANNQHDGNAVAVYFGKAKLGYVPRDQNAEIAAALDQGASLSAEIVHEAVLDRGAVRFAPKISVRAVNGELL